MIESTVFSTYHLMLLNFFYGVIAVAASLGFLKLCDKFILRNLDFQQELQKNNISVAIVIAAFLYFISTVISSALK